VKLLGMDSPSPDDTRNGYGSGNDSPNHWTLLGAGVVIVEYLANLKRLRSRDVQLIALPLAVQGGDGAPARVVAVDGP
jgi:arylformamidase